MPMDFGHDAPILQHRDHFAVMHVIVPGYKWLGCDA